MKSIQITVCIPLYNGIEFLHEAIASVQSQTYLHWNAIIGINGHGPTGGDVYTTAKSLVANDVRFRVINYPYARNVADVNNSMIEDTSTDWIAHLDADDIWLPQKLSAQVQSLEGQAAGASIIGTQCVYFGDSDKIPPIKSGWIYPEDLFLCNHIINSSTLLRTSVAKYSNRFYGCEDYDLWIRAALSGVKLYNIPQIHVKHRIYQTSQFNASHKQDVLSLRKYYDASEDFTLVTAFYGMSSKFSVQQYMKWIVPFFTRYTGPMVIYTEKQHEDIFRNLRKDLPTHIRVIPPELWEANTKFPSEFWEMQKKKDPESIHTSELYKIWYEKHVFVKRALQENPFGHTKFMWCDAGVCRTPIVESWISGLAGKGNRILKDKMTILEINPFIPEDHNEFQRYSITDFTVRRNRIGGGVLAGGIDAWQKWSDHIETVMTTMFDHSMFVGKDQNVFNNIVLKYPNDVFLIPTDRKTGNDNYWFYLLYYFGCDFSDFLALLSLPSQRSI